MVSRRRPGVAEEGEGEQQAGAGLIEAEAGEVEDKDYGEGAVGEEADEAGEEQEAAVRREATQRAGESGGHPRLRVAWAPEGGEDPAQSSRWKG